MLNKFVTKLLPYLPKKIVKVLAMQYIAGETIEDAIKASKELNKKGIEVTMELLGASVIVAGEAEVYKNKYIELVDSFKKNKLKGNFSIKPTLFGLLIDKELCYIGVHEVVTRAAGYNNFVRLDMEHSAYTDLEIELFKRLKKDFPENVGIAF